MNAETETEKTEEDEVPKKQPSKADYKRMYEEEKEKNELFVIDESAEDGVKIHTIQWRETDGIYKTIAFRAKAIRLEPNEYCKKMIHERLGYY